jgi:hypothetical protein
MPSDAAIAEGSMPGQLAQRPPVSELLAHPLRTFHTVWHLRPKQIAYQALRRVQQSIPRTYPPVDDEPVLLRRRPAPQADASSLAFDGESFCFLNRRRMFEGPNRWHPPGADDLWIFNLHYFKFLGQTREDRAQHLILDWLDHNRDPRSAAWHPYPVSLRVREWIEWLQAHPTAPAALRVRMTCSLAAQVESLRRRLEFNLMGNHLLENAITLCWAGLSFAGSRADAWLVEGAVVLARELRSQVLADGSHEERSPMYQAQLAEALLRLAEVAAQSPAPSASSILAAARDAGVRMLAALGQMVHPDGEYALLNDTALGVAPTLRSLLNRFDVAMPASDRPTWALPAAGLSGCRGGDRYLIFDAGPIGPDHQPGHGHAGALSFELSLRGRRIVTDTGVLTYASGPARRYDRSTAAHNTIEIDRRDQSDVWGAFRCGRRSSVVPVPPEAGKEGATFAGACRAPGRRGSRSVLHERRIVAGSRLFAFTDTLRAGGHHRATLRLHLAPGLRVRPDGRLCRIADETGRPLAALAADGFAWTPSSSPYHPEFGTEIERACVSADLRFRDARVAKWWLIFN